MSVTNWKPRVFKSLRWRRLQLSITVYVHRYATCSDRWVIRPELIWDRK